MTTTESTTQDTDDPYRTETVDVPLTEQDLTRIKNALMADARQNFTSAYGDRLWALAERLDEYSD